MNNDITTSLVSSLTAISEAQVACTIELLNDGATVPFIARYRKERTGNLDEIQIEAIQSGLEKISALQKRKEFITEAIQAAGKFTDTIAKKIDTCWDANELEDIYLPYKIKRKTRAGAARALGLEPLAKIVMAQNAATPIGTIAKRYVSDKVTDTASAIAGAKDIIAEWVSENGTARKAMRRIYERQAMLTVHVVKGKEDEGSAYQSCFNFKSRLSSVASHRLLAVLRGEKDGILRISVDIDTDRCLQRIEPIFIHGHNRECSDLIREAIADSFKRLLKPSIDNEAIAAAKQKADDEAIRFFANNLRQLLFAPPLLHKSVLAIDPGYRTGCKVACLNPQGTMLHHTVVYPTAPRNDTAGAGATIRHLVTQYGIEAIAIGNGTASRETEAFVRSLSLGDAISIYVVSESGASVYSASEIARSEFPDEDITTRSAVSIGRRLIDPLAELVKIDPKSIGVGQYQHDVDQYKLKGSLESTVTSCVNQVGVNINCASKQLLQYVAGIGPALAQNIIDYRTEHGDFNARDEIMSVPRMGAKAFQQCAGFLRIPHSRNPLDNSAIHPESYGIVEAMARDQQCSVGQLLLSEHKRKAIQPERYISDTVGMPTLNDILSELAKPGRDPRQQAQVFAFCPDVKTIDDLQPGQTLPGIVNNITQFGAFVDIGVHTSGLVHVSQLPANKAVSALGAVKIGQHVTVRVLDVERERNRISLTMKGVEQ